MSISLMTQIYDSINIALSSRFMSLYNNKHFQNKTYKPFEICITSIYGVLYQCNMFKTRPVIIAQKTLPELSSSS